MVAGLEAGRKERVRARLTGASQKKNRGGGLWLAMMVTVVAGEGKERRSWGCGQGWLVPGRRREEEGDCNGWSDLG